MAKNFKMPKDLQNLFGPSKPLWTFKKTSLDRQSLFVGSSCVLSQHEHGQSHKNCHDRESNQHENARDRRGTLESRGQLKSGDRREHKKANQE